MKEKMKIALTGAIAATIAAGISTMSLTSLAAKSNQEKCYGIAKAGENACGTPTHGCNGYAKTDCDGSEWIWVDKGTCTQKGGKLTPSSQKGTASYCNLQKD